jgi:hypothetical protein
MPKLPAAHVWPSATTENRIPRGYFRSQTRASGCMLTRTHSIQFGCCANGSEPQRDTRLPRKHLYNQPGTILCRLQPAWSLPPCPVTAYISKEPRRSFAHHTHHCVDQPLRGPPLHTHHPAATPLATDKTAACHTLLRCTPYLEPSPSCHLSM